MSHRGERDLTVGWNYGQTNDLNLDSRFASEQTGIKKVWHLQHFRPGSNDPFFYFCMQGKEGRQRLSVKNDCPQNSSELQVTAKGREGYNNLARTVWRIEVNNN